jgi:DNA primase
VPAPHDPDSFIKANGGGAFHQLIEHAAGFYDYFLNRLCEENDVTTDQGRMFVVKAMLTTLQKTGNTILLDDYGKKTAQRLGITNYSIAVEFKKLLEHPQNYSGDDEETPPETISKPLTHEFWLLKLLFLHDELADWTAAHLNPDWIQHSLVRQIVSKRLAAHRTNNWTGLAAFLSECDSAEMQNLITEAAAEDRPIPNPEQQLADVAVQLRNQFMDRELSALSQRVNQPATSETERLEILHRQQELRQLKRQPLTPPAEN